MKEEKKKKKKKEQMKKKKKRKRRKKKRSRRKKRRRKEIEEQKKKGKMRGRLAKFCFPQHVLCGPLRYPHKMKRMRKNNKNRNKIFWFNCNI